MALERIHLYHLVRVLRVLIPVLVLTFASVFAWNYFTRPMNGPSADAEARLQENMSAMTEGRTYVQGGDDCFTVEARKDLGFEGGINQLEGVEVTLGGCDGTPERRIRGAECGVHRLAGVVRIQCAGSVEVDLDPRTTLRTERLGYDSASETISSAAPVRIVRSGEFEAQADGMSFNAREEVFHLAGGVRVFREDGSQMEAGEVWYDEAGSRLSTTGGLLLTSETLNLSGDSGQAWLTPQTFDLTRLEVRGNVEARSLDAREPGSMSASELDLDFRDGHAETVRARGSVIVESGEEGSRRTLAGDAVAATLDAGGTVEFLETTGSAQLKLGTGETIRSRRITQTRDGAIVTTGDSLLEAGAFTVRGSQFRIERDALVRFTTGEFASIVSPSGVFEGDSTTATFDPDSGILLSMEQTGSVRFESGGRNGSADRVAIDGGWVELDGGARIEDAEFALEGDTIRLGRTDDSVEAFGQVFLAASRAGEPVFVEGDRLEGRTEDTLHFSGSVVLRQGGRQVLAGLMDLDPGGRAFVASEGVVSTMGDIAVRSDTLFFDDASGRIEYSGDVRARTDRLTLDSRFLEVTMAGGEVDRIDAAGDVRVTSADGMEGSGESAVYRRSEGTVTLVGPGAEAFDPLTGRCSGDEIAVDIRTHDVRVYGQDGRRAVCAPVTVPES